MSQPSENHRFLDGPRFVEWLFEVRPEIEDQISTYLGHTILRRISDYRRGGCPDAYEVPDRICVKLGLHLDDIPDSIWLQARPRVKGRRIPWVQRRPLQLLDEGYYPTEVAHQLDVAVNTVRRWAEREKVAA